MQRDTGRTHPLNNAAYLVAANLGTRVFTLLLLLYTTRTLGTLYGNYVAVINFVGLFSIVTDPGLSTVTVRDVVQDRSQERRYISNTLLLRLLFAVLDIVLIIALAQLFVAADLRVALYVYALALVPLTVSGTLQLVFQIAERQAYSAVLGIVTTMLRVALSFAVLYTGHHVLGLSLVYTLATTLGALATAWFVYRRFLPYGFELDVSWWPALLRRAAPFAVLSLLSYFYASIDMQILYVLSGCGHLKGNVGCTATAQYGAAYQVLNVMTATFTTAISAAIFPAINRVAAESHGALTRLVRSSYTLMLVFGVPVALFIAAFTPFVMHVVGGRHSTANFMAAAPALSILIWDIPCFLITNLLGTALLAVHRQKLLMVSFGVTLAFNVVLNLLLIPHYSYMASSVLTVASEFVNGAIIIVALRRAIGPLGLVPPTLRVGVAATVVALALWALHPFGIVVGLPAGLIVALLAARVMRVLDAPERAVVARLPIVGRYAAAWL